MGFDKLEGVIVQYYFIDNSNCCRVIAKYKIIFKKKNIKNSF